MAVFWVVAPCRLERVHRRFRGLYCLHLQGDECMSLPTFRGSVLPPSSGRWVYEFTNVSGVCTASIFRAMSVWVYQRFRGLYCLHLQGDECMCLPKFQRSVLPPSSERWVYEFTKVSEVCTASIIRPLKRC
jgi:hypothetical protein